MTPTMKLRFVEREITENVINELFRTRKVRVLQQWWEDEPPWYDENGNSITGEWRDVPLETEE